jgi:hypothetical protein
MFRTGHQSNFLFVDLESDHFGDGAFTGLTFGVRLTCFSEIFAAESMEIGHRIFSIAARAVGSLG